QRRVAHYRDRCLQCHGKDAGADGSGCALPKAERLKQRADDSCIDCHMPRYSASNIPHTAVTDHRILRTGKPVPRDDTKPMPGDGLPIRSFYRGRKALDEAEDDRRRAIAVVKLTMMGDAAALRAARLALPALDAALQHDPDDLPAGEAKGYALSFQERRAEALAAFEAVLARAPDRETALVGAASAAEALGQTPAA